ncbi:unnamed protein product, partial [Brenthis ino]
MTRRAANMFVCIRLDLFDWVTHTSAALPRRGCIVVGAHHYTRSATTARQMVAHTHAAKGKATLCKQIAGVSAVPLGYKAGVCHMIVCCRHDPT